MFPRPPHLVEDESDRAQQEFPSVCLIGLGRCGSNIALDVAELVYNARKFYLNEFNAEDKAYSDKGYSPRSGSATTCVLAPARPANRCSWWNRW